ncbi:uncharacterized protein ACO6RY_01251 [Pungitius sinensis]
MECACRKQTGPLTSTGVPSPPSSHEVSSPCSGGLPTAGVPPQDPMTPGTEFRPRAFFLRGLSYTSSLPRACTVSIVPGRFERRHGSCRLS